MINKETILSVYADKLTLMEALEKVKDALENATLESADVVSEGENLYHLHFVFADGSELDTPTFEIPQQITGAYIQNGVFYLTLNDGTIINGGSVGATFSNIVVGGVVGLSSSGISIQGGNITLDGQGDSLSVDGDISAGGDLNIHGNAEFDADLIVNGSSQFRIVQTEGISATNGDITAVNGYLETDEYVRPSTTTQQLDINNVNGGISVPTLPDGVECNFVFARVSNGKLSMGVQISNPANTTITSGTFGFTITIPATIGNKLYPNSDNYLCREVKKMCGSLGERSNYFLIGVQKQSATSLFINIYCSNLGTGASGIATLRWEQNFVL